MSENVYAPPQADLGAGAEPPLGTGDLDIGRCLSEGWARTWANFPLWLGAGAVLILALLASVVTILGIFLLVPVLYWGGFNLGLRMYDGGASVRDVFAGFSRYGRALGGMLGFFLVSMVLSLPGSVLAQVGALSKPPSLALSGLGNLIQLGIALFVTPRLTFVPYLMIERDLSLGEAISLAWARTAKVWGKLALMIVAMGGVALAGVVAFIVGVFPAMVVVFLMWSSAYRQIFGGAPHRAA